MTELNRKWSLLCPGPSLDDWSKEDIDTHRNYQVAVNAAIKFETEPLQWCMLDDLTFKKHYQDVRRDTALVVPHSWEGRKDNENMQLYDVRDQYTKYPKYYFPGGQKSFSDVLGFGHGIIWTLYSTISAIGWIIIMGANEIDIYGHDMEGTYPDKYWRKMNSQYTSLVSLAKENGVKINRKFP